MTVAQLIAALAVLDPTLPVYVGSVDCYPTVVVQPTTLLNGLAVVTITAA